MGEYQLQYLNNNYLYTLSTTNSYILFSICKGRKNSNFTPTQFSYSFSQMIANNVHIKRQVNALQENDKLKNLENLVLYI